MNTHSPTTASDILGELNKLNDTIQNTLLIGEKVALIYETGRLYNHLKSLVTPDYFTDEEMGWLQDTAKSWNEDVIGYAQQQSPNSDISAEDNLEDLQRTIQEVLDDIIGGLDDMEDYIDGI